jgi:hypothetical protein
LAKSSWQVTGRLFLKSLFGNLCKNLIICQTEKSQREAAEEQISGFLTEVFAASDPQACL